MLLRTPFTRDARVLREARALVQAGHDVTVLALRAGDLPEREERDGFVVLRAVEAGVLAGPTIGIAAGSGARRLPRLPLVVWARDKLLARKMHRAAAGLGADVYHAHDLNTLEPAAQAAQMNGAHLVYDAHELYPDLTGLARGERARWRRLERRLIGRADVVIAPSASRADELASCYGIARPKVVMNCPPGARTVGHTGGQLAGLRRDDETLLVYAGGFTPNRGLENVIVAAKRLDRCRLVMLGLGPLEGRLRALAGDRVVFAGSVEPDDVVAAITACDIGLAPYLPIGRNNELAAPNKVFEYMHAGLAVAASDVPDVRRIVDEHGVGALFDASDPDSIAQTVSEMVPRLDEFRRNARRAASSYSWESQEEVLLDVYQSLRPRSMAG
jgi:glycosyltransferase involved in cell wall biosynthesis